MAHKHTQRLPKANAEAPVEQRALQGPARAARQEPLVPAARRAAARSARAARAARPARARRRLLVAGRAVPADDGARHRLTADSPSLGRARVDPTDVPSPPPGRFDVSPSLRRSPAYPLDSEGSPSLVGAPRRETGGVSVR